MYEKLFSTYKNIRGENMKEKKRKYKFTITATKVVKKQKTEGKHMLFLLS